MINISDFTLLTHTEKKVFCLNGNWLENEMRKIEVGMLILALRRMFGAILSNFTKFNEILTVIFEFGKTQRKI
jgi:hypothetical protein